MRLRTHNCFLEKLTPSSMRVVKDYIEPATGHVVQEKLGADKEIAFDVSNA